MDVPQIEGSDDQARVNNPRGERTSVADDETKDGTEDRSEG
jgi:hypothetical protein